MGSWGLATGEMFKATSSRAPEKHLLEYRIKTGVFIGLSPFPVALMYTGVQQDSSAYSRIHGYQLPCKLLFLVSITPPITSPEFTPFSYIKTNEKFQCSSNVCKMTSLHRLSNANEHSGFASYKIELHSHFMN